MAAAMNMALYRLLVKQGATEPEAEEASRIDTSDLATKADIEMVRREIAELKADLTWRMVLMIGVFIAAVSALKMFS